MKRTPLRKISPKSRTSQREWRSVTREAIKAAKGVCQVRAEGCTVVAVEGHHKRLRSQGGLNEVSNCIVCCPSCHRWCHFFPAKAAAMGFIETAKASETT